MILDLVISGAIKKMQVQRFDVVTKQQNYLIEIGKHRLQEHKIFY